MTIFCNCKEEETIFLILLHSVLTVDSKPLKTQAAVLETVRCIVGGSDLFFQHMSQVFNKSSEGGSEVSACEIFITHFKPFL